MITTEQLAERYGVTTEAFEKSMHEVAERLPADAYLTASETASWYMQIEVIVFLAGMYFFGSWAYVFYTRYKKRKEKDQRRQRRKDDEASSESS